MLGTNGGGFFNANSAIPYENPTPLVNFLEQIYISIFGGAHQRVRPHGQDQRQGWAVFAVMSILFLTGVIVCYWAEGSGNPQFAALGLDPGNMEGKEVRFGLANSSLWAVVTTDASYGAVNAMHDSFTPLGGMIPLLNIQLGEIIFGGVGSGIYGMLLMVIIAVFVAGLMVGRTPEYVGKKIEAKEVKMAMLAILILPLGMLGFTAVAVVLPFAVASIANPGPHGFTEAFTSTPRTPETTALRSPASPAIRSATTLPAPSPCLSAASSSSSRPWRSRARSPPRSSFQPPPAPSRPMAGCSSAWLSA